MGMVCGGGVGGKMEIYGYQDKGYPHKFKFFKGLTKVTLRLDEDQILIGINRTTLI